MPFTASHALVALPFVRTPLVPAAIAIGAMTPDLPLFTHGIGASYGFTHSASNTVWTALIALGLLVVWRTALRPALVLLAPDAVAARLPGSWRRTGLAAVAELFAPRGTGPVRVALAGLLLAVSLLLGVLSHIVWDLFTHEGRWAVAAIPLLEADWGPMPGYKWLQHGSSAIGLLIIAVYALLWLRGRSAERAVRTLPAWLRWSWYSTLPVALITGWCVGLVVHGPPGQELTVQQLAYRTLPAACGVWGAASLVLCIAVVAATGRHRA
ncbi:DUF4184 family protein [Microbacterium soli]|uniref:DUF4184 family protein n=1 Tax=Microbacterium soli TaxID=446075 RepID=A0ABP7NDL5_9MICO